MTEKDHPEVMKRNIGLDLARAIAILFILTSHGRHFFSQYLDVQFMSFTGLFGVELFFVLSGFLIGGILLREIVPHPTLHTLKKFYFRRWFRTLPLYWLIFSILAVVAVSKGAVIYFDHLLFLQNFSFQKINFFAVAWSLSIEEWFYLLIPALLLIVMRSNNTHRKHVFFIFCIALILFFSCLRVFAVLKFNPDWDFGVRKQIFLRLDSLMTGVLLAGIKHYYSKSYEYFARYSAMIISLTVSAFIFVGGYYIIFLEAGRQAMNQSFFGRTGIFNLISLLFAIFIYGLENNETLLRFSTKSVFVKVVTFISVTSYAVYLIHYDIYFFFIRKFSLTNPVYSALLLGTTLIIIYLCAALLYRKFEQPILRYRDRVTLKLR